MERIKAVIFDLGGVLIDWNPRHLFDEHYFPTLAQRDFFLENICTDAWNENQDAGYAIDRATEEKVLEFPEWESAIRDYYGRWEKMLKGEIPETVALFRRLKKNKELKIYALTNWSAETFPLALERFEFLQWFDGRVVSGEEKTRKPFPEFYQRLFDKYEIDPTAALFIDDNLRNVKAAEGMGLISFLYESPEQLQKKLEELRLI